MRHVTFRPAALVLLTVLLSAAALIGCKVSPEDIPGGVAVVYGVADYVDADINDLTYTDDDGRAMRDIFIAKYGAPNVIYREAIGDPGDDATIAQLELDLQWAESMVGPNDNFVFYFSGHGGQAASLPESREGSGSDSYNEMLFFQEAAFDSNTNTWTDGALSEDDLLALIRDIPTYRKFVIIDACNSGGFIGTAADTDLTSQDYDSESVIDGLSRAIDLYIRYPDTAASDIPYDEAIVLSAAGEREESFESGSIEHGIFTYFFLEVPSRGDLNGDGAVTIDEAFQYTADQIEQNWNRYYSFMQFHPHVSGGPINYVLFAAD